MLAGYLNSRVMSTTTDCSTPRIHATPVFEYTSTVETWIFTRTTTVEEDTVNVVTVTGTPTDQTNSIGPDVSADDEAEVEVIDELTRYGCGAHLDGSGCPAGSGRGTDPGENRRRLSSS